MIKVIYKKERYIFAIGLLVVLTAMLPYLILGEDMIVFYPDQLDGEVLGYILHAKYLFTGIDTYPEMMNGISANGLFPPAPLLVLLYKILRPSVAFVCNQIFLHGNCIYRHVFLYKNDGKQQYDCRVLWYFICILAIAFCIWSLPVWIAAFVL